MKWARYSGNGSCVCSLFLLNPTLPFHLPGKSLKSRAIFWSQCATAGRPEFLKQVIFLGLSSNHIISSHFERTIKSATTLSCCCKISFEKWSLSLFPVKKVKRRKTGSREKEALIHFIPPSDCLSQNITFSHESHSKNNMRNVQQPFCRLTWGGAKIQKGF